MTLGIFDVIVEEGRFFFHPHQERSPHMQASSQKLQQPRTLQAS